MVRVANHRGLVHDVDGVRRLVVHSQLSVQLEGLCPVLLTIAVLDDVIERVDGLVDRIGRGLGFAGDDLGRFARRRRQDVVATDGTEVLGQALGDEGFSSTGVTLEEEDAFRVTVEKLSKSIYQGRLSIVQLEL